MLKTAKLTRVEITLHKSGLLVTPKGETKGEIRLTLAQKLAVFDPKLHGGELVATATSGTRRLDGCPAMVA